ncbi:uncharacterized protein LOC112554298 [Pomacea canaliculata]|uniref:uncharacterized protein LOC112554298 n=1 Tax=Pomacea canaliculata TaxID=400727 RepID=UPI000D72BF58|nr:uncharacterized protein LOC112554298 [Pomacea canaliculata]
MDQKEIIAVLETSKKLLSEMSEKKFEVCNVSVDAEQTSFMLRELQKKTTELKDNFCEILTKNHLMQCLSAHRTQWPMLVSDADTELQKAKDILRDAKQEAEKQREGIMQLNAIVVQGLSVYEQQKKLLREKIHILEGLVEDMQKVKREICEDSRKRAVCEELEEKVRHTQNLQLQCQMKLLDAEQAVEQLQMKIANKKRNLLLLDQMWDNEEEKRDREHIEKLQKCDATIQELGRVECQVVGPEKIVLKFSPCPSQDLKMTQGIDEDFEKNMVPMLTITLTFKTDALGCVYIADVKSDMESLDIGDLWQEKKLGWDDLSSLVLAIKTRWFSHIPLLSEVHRLRNRFAVDWIQKENILRVIMGKGGNVVCSLAIPPSYPKQGEVTLANIIGAPDFEEPSSLKPPASCGLEDWVLHLEKIFGKP